MKSCSFRCGVLSLAATTTSSLACFSWRRCWGCGMPLSGRKHGRCSNDAGAVSATRSTTAKRRRVVRVMRVADHPTTSTTGGASKQAQASSRNNAVAPHSSAPHSPQSRLVTAFAAAVSIASSVVPTNASRVRAARTEDKPSTARQATRTSAHAPTPSSLPSQPHAQEVDATAVAPFLAAVRESGTAPAVPPAPLPPLPQRPRRRRRNRLHRSSDVAME